MAEAEIQERRSISVIWLVPIVALVLGGWLVFTTWRDQGPAITISFATAEGIETDKTKIRFRSVVVGVVEGVGLSDDLSRVAVEARIDQQAEPLLRQDAQFFVVRPRVGAQGVSGLGTLLSGPYIELVPGTGAAGRRDFVGLDELPVTPAGTDGLHLVLESEQGGSVGPGNPILYRGFQVGRVETSRFDVDARRMYYDAFIEAPYDDLVNAHSRFWNTSGVSFEASADGVEIHTGSLETVLSGGIAFGLPEDIRPGPPVQDGARFDLYPNLAKVNQRPYRESIEYVLQFDQSVRGLRPGAPVEYRGIRTGSVVDILLDQLVDEESFGSGSSIPVLVRIEPGRFELGDTPESLHVLEGGVARAVGNGLRATLSTGNLLTGSLYVALDIHENAPPAEMGEFAGRPTIPTMGGGLDGLQTQLSMLLDKLNDLPLEGAVESADATLAQLESTLAALDEVIASEAMKQLPATLTKSIAQLERTLATLSPDSDLVRRLSHTLAELDKTLARLDGLATTLSEKPNALIFPIRSEQDPEPPRAP